MSLTLNNTIQPTPAPVLNPAINAPKLIAFDKYSCDKIIEDAQLGMSPSNPAITG